MDVIPNCRQNEAYSQNNLKKEDKNFVYGFDWAVEETVDVFFNNMSDLCDESSYIGHFLNEKLPESLKEEYVMEFAFPVSRPKDPENRKIETYADFIRMKLLMWMENERNRLITSMIDFGN